MDNNAEHPSNNTLHQAAMPERVLLICDGLLQINADFFDVHLNKLLTELESVLFKNAESHKNDVLQGEHLASLRNLKRTRYDFIPRFLAAVEHHIANIRPIQVTTITSHDPKATSNTELQLIDHHESDEDQIQFEITTRCESQNSFDIFQLGQRFGVLAGKPAFEADKLPIGPKIFSKCLQESIHALDLTLIDKRNVYILFERYVFTNFPILLDSCNQFLIENGVLPNLSYVPFRNPELRNKKSPYALHGTIDRQASKDQQLETNVIDFDNKNVLDSDKLGNSAAAEYVDTVKVEESFVNLRHLLAKRKLLLNKLGSFSNAYSNDNTKLEGEQIRTVDAPAEVLGSILNEFQTHAANNPNSRATIQHLKQDLLVHLRNQSTESKELTLKEEDSDAIDLVGMLMDNALKDVNPNSAASQLLSLMQTPLIRVVLQDKSFFSNRVHPARKMLNIIAETGFNWLDESQQDDNLHGKISSIVNNTVRQFNGDNKELVGAYEETNRILQALIKKAEAAEKRQIEAASGKERLNIARARAEKTMSELVESYDIPQATLSLLNQAWTDVMALTELRQGSDSNDWLEQKEIAESIIEASLPESLVLDEDQAEMLKTKIQESLALIGYHQDEALNIAESLLNQKLQESPEPTLFIPERIRFGGNTQSANRNSYLLNDQQQEWVERIKQLPIGTWFEFVLKDNPTPARRKIAWKSEVTNNILFVNQRGQKTAEMMIEELAIEIYEGRAQIQVENKRSIIEWAFEGLLKSLRNILPGKQDNDNE